MEFSSEVTAMPGTTKRIHDINKQHIHGTEEYHHERKGSQLKVSTNAPPGKHTTCAATICNTKYPTQPASIPLTDCNRTWPDRRAISIVVIVQYITVSSGRERSSRTEHMTMEVRRNEKPRARAHKSTSKHYKHPPHSQRVSLTMGSKPRLDNQSHNTCTPHTCCWSSRATSSWQYQLSH